MKKLLIGLMVLISINSFSQYSDYYKVDVQQNVNLNENVNGTINVNKNISTIDYGQLAIANAQRERNRLENLRYTDEREKNIYLSVAENPLVAYDYGEPSITFDKNKYGFKKFTFSYIAPHKSLFVRAGDGRLENVSNDDITTEIVFAPPQYTKEVVDVEALAKLGRFKVNEMNKKSEGNDSMYVLKKYVNRATVWGYKGFVGTLIWEDEYQNTITDNYISLSTDNIRFFVKVRYYGDKDNVTFEQLEGRKYYLKKLIEKVISTGTLSDYKLAN